MTLPGIEPCRSCRVKRGCGLLIFQNQDQKIAACRSSYMNIDVSPDAAQYRSDDEAHPPPVPPPKTESGTPPAPPPD